MSIEFPGEFPMLPPTVKFVTSIWHPNGVFFSRISSVFAYFFLVYIDGNVCISILHPPHVDETSGESLDERWLPTRSIASIMISIMSMLNDPNINSPANLSASVEYRDNRDKFTERCRALAQESLDKVPSHVVIPHPETNPKEREASILRHKALSEDDLLDDQPVVKKKEKKSSKKASKHKEIFEEEDESLDLKEQQNLTEPMNNYNEVVPIFLNPYGSKAKRSKHKVVTLDSLTILMYNVLRYPSVSGETRYEYIIDVILEAQADMIVLTQVSTVFFQKITNSDWIKDYYVISDPELQKETSLHVGVLLLSRFAPETTCFYPIHTRTSACFMYSAFSINKSNYLIGIISMDEGETERHLRFYQWGFAKNTMDHMKTLLPNHTAFIMGDFVMGAKSKENKYIMQSGWKDVWMEKHPKDPGYTLNPHENPLAHILYNKPTPLRRDRIYFDTSVQAAIRDVTLVGKKVIPGEKYKGKDLYPSDRFGIRVTLNTPRARIEEKSCSIM